MDSSINLAQDDVRRVLIPKFENSPHKFRDEVVKQAQNYAGDAFGATSIRKQRALSRSGMGHQYQTH